MYVAHIDKLVYVVGVGLQNDSKEPSKALLTTLGNNLSQTELISLFVKVVQLNQLQAFFDSIVLMRGMDVMSKTSPVEPEEMIAPGV